jgi:hypothetical protein
MITTTTILDCGHVPTPQPPDSITTGYGTTRDGQTLCFECCNTAERADLATADRYTAYLGGDGTSLTTWTEAKLATVTRLYTVRNNFAGKLYRFWAIAPGGVWWYGTTPGKGMYARMRRSHVETAKEQRIRGLSHTVTR